MRKNAVIGIIALAVLTITTGIVLTRPRGPQPDTPNQTPDEGKGHLRGRQPEARAGLRNQPVPR